MRRFLDSSKSLSCIIGVIVALSVFNLTAWGGEPETWKTMSLNWFTGDPTGTGYSMAIATDLAIKKVIPTLGTTKFIPTGINAIVAAVDSGKGNIGGPVSSFAVVSAARGQTGFDKPLSHNKVIVALSSLLVQILVNADSGIQGVADLKGKRIAKGPPGSTTAYILDYLLEAHGMSGKDVKLAHLGYADSADAFRNGQVDAVLLAANIPFPAFVDLSRARNIRLIQLTDQEIDVLHRNNNSFLRTTLPGRTYKGVDYDVKTAEAPLVMIVHDTLPNEFVYNAVKGIVGGLKEISVSAPGMEKFRPEQLARDIGVPFHPGAEKHYKELGWLK